jgi:sialate O-acetylesterase
MKSSAFLRRIGSLFTGIAIVFVMDVFSQTTPCTLAPLFQDNMVLQQQCDVPVWGKGVPGTEVVLQASWGIKVSSVVLSDGSWKIKLPTPKAGGPFQMSIRHGKTLLVLKNVLAGEVWLCSGQSNMEMPLQGWPPSDTIKNSVNEIEGALYPSIRLYSVMKSYEAMPDDQCVGSWTECSPLDVQDFSAVAYYFGKTLHTALHVPVGLINTSYGGTSIEAWMSANGLKSFEEFSATLKKIDQSRESFRSLTQWITQHPAVAIRDQDPLRKWTGLSFGDEHCSEREYNDSSWETMKLPTLWEQASIGEFDGAVWFRKRVTIPSAWIGKNLLLQLGPIDDMDETYVNGQEVGKYLSDGFWNTNRVYIIDKSMVKDSLLQVAVRVIDLRGGGGLWGNGTKMMVCQAGPADAGTAESGTTSVPLEGDWKYLPVAEYRTNVFYVFGAAGNEFARRPKFAADFSPNTPTALFNAMVNPLVPFAIRGAVWYQGENNVSNPALYDKLFPAMIADWRAVFSSGDFPFYFVQIAPYNYDPLSQSQFLREAQFHGLSVKNTGMAVTMDIGNPKNIHPTNKEEVGKRLANLALAKTYGKNMPFSGPLYKSMKIVKGKIILSFDYAAKGLVLKARNGSYNITIAGEDKIFKTAVVKIDRSRLIVSHPDEQKPVAVRYAWSNGEEGTLFNRDGLPASSFRTDHWKE